jgi:type IV pilus assembly protein PilC
MRVKYTAKDLRGRTVRGQMDAGSMKAAAGLIREQKLVPLEISEVKKSPGILADLKMSRGVSSADLTNFTRQLATMITAGLPLTDALNLLKIQSGPAMSIVVSAVLLDVQAGVSLSAAMGKHPKVFNPVYLSLVRAGESAGLMEKVLLRLADTAEKSREFRSKVTGALIYPLIIVVGMVGVFILMIVLVIPQMSSLYKEMNTELPFATKAMIGISDFALQWKFPLIAVFVGGFFGLRSFIQTNAGREFSSRAMYKVPIVGPLLLQSGLAEFARTMSLLLSAGVSVVESLKICTEVMGNMIMERAIKRIANQVEKGFPVSISFSESPEFPSIFGQMMAVGEETGKMDDVLAKLSYYLESESNEKIKGLTTAIEPIILIVLAVGIGFLMYAIIMPIYQITNQV